MKKSVLIAFHFFFISTIIYANNDSLRHIWNSEEFTPIDRLNAMDKLFFEVYLFNKPDSAFIICKEMYQFAEDNKLYDRMAAALQAMGGSFYFKSEYDSALKYYNLSLQKFTEIDNTRGKASTMGNMANVYTDKGDYRKGIEYYHKSLKMHEETGHLRGQGVQLMNIGLVYYEQSEFEKALEFYNKSLELHEKEDFKYGISDCMINIGEAYFKLREYDKAVEWNNRALKINDDIDDAPGKALIHNNIGKNYAQQKKYKEALEQFFLALEIQKKVGITKDETISMIHIGNTYASMGEKVKSEKILVEALRKAKEIGSVNQIRDAAKALKPIYFAKNQFAKSLEMSDLYYSLRDSIASEENQRGLLRQEYKYNYEKEALLDSLEFSKKEAIKDLEIEKQRANLFKQRIALGATAAGLILLMVLAYSIRKGKKRSDELLLNILPAEVAAELKKKGYADAKEFEQVTVLFTDFQNFTSASAKLSATELVEEINSCYKEFDFIMEKYGIEKIKTIGDAYMAGGGLPVPSKNSVKNTVLAALEMQEFMTAGYRGQGTGLRVQGPDKYREGVREQRTARLFEMRVGIHTGPVVAGIVGVKKFQYDIWGDTVNTASRVESNGEIGKVNISQATYDLLKNDFDFIFDKRGKIEVKGKGVLEMYFVSRSIG